VVLAGSLLLAGQTPALSAQCPAASEPTATVAGFIRLPDGTPAAAASILVSWTGGSRSSIADDSGAYLVCEIPVGEPLGVIASAAWGMGQSIEISLPRAETYEMDLDVPSRPAAEAREGTSGIRGVVVDATTGETVSGARVRDRGAGREALTGAAGAFRIDRLPGGTADLEVEHIGYGVQYATVELSAGASEVVRLALSPRALDMPPIEVVVQGQRLHALEVRGFYERRSWGERTGTAAFFEKSDIERRRPRRISQLIEEVPGVTIDCRGTSSQSRDCDVVIRKNGFCQRADVFIDGMHVVSSEKGFHDPLDAYVLPSEVAAVEVYTGPAGLPAEFSGSTGQCGTVVIWTG
jgi:hypothetical protein